MKEALCYIVAALIIAALIGLVILCIKFKMVLLVVSITIASVIVLLILWGMVYELGDFIYYMTNKD